MACCRRYAFPESCLLTTESNSRCSFPTYLSNAEREYTDRCGDCRCHLEEDPVDSAEQHRRLLFEAFSHQDILAVASEGVFRFDSNPLIAMLLRPAIVNNISEPFLAAVRTYTALCVFNSPCISPDCTLTKVRMVRHKRLLRSCCFSVCNIATCCIDRQISVWQHWCTTGSSCKSTHPNFAVLPL